MKTAVVLTATLFAAAWTASADFSYATTQKATGGQMAAMAAGSNQNSKFFLKGQKMKTENGDTATILDFDAQTITMVNNTQKTVSVHKFSELGAGGVSDVNAKIDVKETGQKKTINGYNASEIVMTIQVDGPAEAQMGKMTMEMDMWISPDPPGAKELRAFYQKNMNKFPWAAMAGGAQGNPGMQKAMADMQRKLAELNGVNVMEVVKMKASGAGGAPAMPQMSAEQMEQMKAAMAKLQAQGGQQGAAAQQAMARMQAMQGGGAGASSGSLMETTMESTGFSTSAIPDSEFAVPAGYRKVN